MYYVGQVEGNSMRGPTHAPALSAMLSVDGAAVPPATITYSPDYNGNGEMVMTVSGKKVVLRRSTDEDYLDNYAASCNYNRRYKHLGGLLYRSGYYYNTHGVRIVGFHSVFRTHAFRTFLKERLAWFGPGTHPSVNEWKTELRKWAVPGTSSVFTYHSNSSGRTIMMTWKWKLGQDVESVLNQALDHKSLEDNFVEDDENYERRVPGEDVELDMSVVEFKDISSTLRTLPGSGGGTLRRRGNANGIKWFDVTDHGVENFHLGEYDCLMANILSVLPDDKCPHTLDDIINFRQDWRIPDETYLGCESIRIIESKLDININVYLDDLRIARKYFSNRHHRFGRMHVECWSHKYYYQSMGYAGFTVNLLLHDEHYWRILDKKTIGFSPLAAMPYAKSSSSKPNRADIKMPTRKQEMAFLFSLASDGDSDAKKILVERRIPAFSVPVPTSTPLNISDEVRHFPKYCKFRSGIRSYLKANGLTISPDRWKPNLEFLERMKFRSIVYDVETIYDPEQNNACTPYSLAYVVLEHDLHTGLPIFDYGNKEEEWMHRTRMHIGANCFDELFDELSDGDKRATILVGFNSSRFDNFMFIEELLKRGEKPEMFWAQNSILNIRWNGHSTFDAFNFVRTSLDFACKSYNTNPKKQAGFDHEIPQRAYHNDGWMGLMDWTIKEKRKLTEYNKLDVLSLADLYVKLSHVVQNCCGKNTRIYDYLTIGSLAYDVWKRMTNEDFLNKQEARGATGPDDPKSVENIKWDDRSRYEYSDINVLPKFMYEEDMRMRKACIGGRVQVFQNQGKPQSYDGEFAMVDVKSLYPFVMKTFDYPNGSMRVVDTEVPGALGIYRCKIINQPAKRVVPRKIAGKPLDWHNVDNVEFERWLVTPDIDCIRRYGGEVHVYEGFCFGGKGRVFKKYVDIFEKLKNQQDEWKTLGDLRFNPAEREFYKLILNNLSGKVMQRTFLDRAKLCNFSAQALQFVSTLDPDSIDFGIVNGSVLITGKVSDMPKFGRMPSVLGMYIYSYARTYMYDTLISRYPVLYMDTDSALLFLEDYRQLICDQPHLFADIMQRSIKFGDLEEEVIHHDEYGIHPADHVVLLRPKSYMVLNSYPNCGKSKMKLKGVGKRDRYLPSFEQVEIVRRLLKDEDYPALDEIYTTGTCDRLGINFAGCGNLNCTQRDVFDSMYRHRVGHFLCHSFQRKRSFTTEWDGDAKFNIVKRYMIKKLSYSDEEDVNFIDEDREMQELENDMFVLDDLMNIE